MDYPVQRNDALADQVDAEFTRRVQALKRKHHCRDIWGIPRDEWHELQRWRTERYAEVWGRDPQTRERVYVPRPKPAPGPRRAEQTATERLKAALQAVPGGER